MKGGDIRKGHRKQEVYTQETDYEMVHGDLTWPSEQLEAAE